MAFDEAGDKAGRFDLFHKVAQERRTSRVFPGRADRLLNRGKPAFDDARAGQLFQVREKPRPKAGECVELATHELLVGAIERFRSDQLSVLDIAIEPKA